MLRLMLDAHPGISNPGEFDFLTELVGRDGRMPSPTRYRRWLATDRIFLDTRLAVDTSLDYRQLVASFIEQLRRRDRVLTLNMHHHFERIPHLFPDARYIHLLRDPRDVARSSIGMGWAGNVYRGVDIWAVAERSWDRLAATLTPDRYLEIRYEDLLQNVTGELEKICHFLGLDYSAQMLSYPSRSTYAAPDAQLRYQWKKQCSPTELAWVDWKLGSMLQRRQYEASAFGPRRPTLLQRATLAVQDKSYRIRFRIKRYGLGLYLENFLASRLRMAPWLDSCRRRINEVDAEYLK
jgi:hypothetical protein